MALAIAALCAGCLYHMPIQQGNFLDANQVAQVEPGMTRPQVSFLLGTPMVPNGFNNDRWDYYYFIKVGRKASGTDSKRLTVWFKDDKVDHVDRSDAPVANEAVTAAQKAEAAEPGANRAKLPPVAPPATATPAATPPPGSGPITP
jgi:outer membrane protein assembly factor BamE